MTANHEAKRYITSTYGVLPEVDNENAERDFEEGYFRGFDAAVAVFNDKFFGGPTKDMVQAWFDQARESASTDD